MKITIETMIAAPIHRVWSAWVTPADITQWNFASDEWCCPRASINLVVGGTFNYRMEARDGSMGFDFEGTFTSIHPQSMIEYSLGDNRIVKTSFTETEAGVHIVTTFDAEQVHSAEQQRQGWLCILQNFRKHVEHQQSANP